MPAAWRIQVPPSPREWISTSRQPDSSSAPSATWICAAPVSPSTSGTSSTSSRSDSQPASPPACSASSTKAVPGSTTLPSTAWSASHGWLVSERRPVKSHSPFASSTAAPSSGCSAEACPAATTSPPPEAEADANQ